MGPVTVPSLQSLQAEFDRGTHHGRVRRMALLGRDEAGSPGLARLLDQLTGLGGYWHQLALVAAVAGNDGERLVAALSSDYPQVRSYAFRHVVLAGDNIDDLFGAYGQASAVERRRLGRLLCSAGRPDVAEQLVRLCREMGLENEAAALLPGCGSSFAAAELPQLDHAVRCWAMLGRRHPLVLLDYLRAGLQAASRSRRDELWQSTAAGVRIACGAEPERVLRLLEELGPSWGPVPVLRERLGALVRAFPSRMTRLLLRAEHLAASCRGGLPRPVLINAAALSQDDRLAWASAVRDSPQHVAALLERLPPSERGILFSATYRNVDTAAVRWPDALLEALPAATRAAETARMLALRAVAEDPAEALATASFLPAAEARPILEKALGAAQADDRADAYRLLVACTRRSRSADELGATLVVLRRLRNEQDPVRLAAAVALAEVPARLFADTHLPDVLQFAETVAVARDSSQATVRQLRRLVLSLLKELPPDAPAARRDMVLATLDRLAGPAGTMTFGQIGRELRTGAEHNLLAALLPRLLEDASRDRFALTISLASGLGRRGWDLDALQSLLRRATKSPADSTVRRAVDLWLAPPRTRGDRVGELVADDPSTVTLAAVLSAATARRQDLLDVLFRPRPLKGRFLTGKVRYVPIIVSGLSRWLPRQHSAYANALIKLIGDSADNPWTRAAAVRALARIPQIGAERVEPFLASPAADVVEAALAGLAWTDQPETQLVRLLGFAGDDRARVAIPAATRCARFTRPRVLGAALDAVLASPTAKITARKEAIRLLARHRPPGALERLVAVAAQDGVHRDVRIAIGRSLRLFLDDPRAWTILTAQASAGASPDEARALVDTLPGHVAERHRRPFGQLIADVTAHPDPLTKMLAFSALAAWSPWVPNAADLTVSSIADLASGPSWQPALRTLTHIFADGHAGAATAQLISALATASGSQETDAGEQRDRPSRQRLAALVDHLTSLDAGRRELLGDDLAGCAAALTAVPTALRWEIALLLSAADLTRLADLIRQLADRLASRPMAVSAAATALAAALQRDRSRWQPEDLRAAASSLIAETSPASQLLAVAIISAAGPRSGWSPAWRDRLRAIRQSADPDVATAALAVITASELSDAR